MISSSSVARPASVERSPAAPPSVATRSSSPDGTPTGPVRSPPRSEAIPAGSPSTSSVPADLGTQLAGVEAVDHLVLAGISRDQNTVADYDIDGALALVTLKLVGYTEVIHQLRPRMADDAAIVVFGGLAKDRPYPGSTTVSTINGGVVGLVHTLATELPPIRINAIHPGIVGDSPFWVGKPLDHVTSRTPIGRLATMADVADAVEFLLRNPAINGVNLPVDGGWLLK